jgi:hypothetical protein
VSRAASILLVVFVLAGTVAQASDTELSGGQGHPRERFPLSVWTQPFNDPGLDGAVRRALDDWNALARDVLGTPVFATAPAREAYIEARRHPDVRSARAELAEHYARVWRQ